MARSQVRLLVGRRTVIDCSLTIAIRVPDLIVPDSKEVLLIYRTEMPYLAAGTVNRYRVSIHRMPVETFERYGPWLPGWRSQLLERAPIDVRDFLRAHPRATVIATVIAHDAITGAPAAIRRRYGIDDFYDGRFRTVNQHPHTSREWFSFDPGDSRPDKAVLVLASRFHSLFAAARRARLGHVTRADLIDDQQGPQLDAGYELVDDDRTVRDHRWPSPSTPRDPRDAAAEPDDELDASSP